MPQNKIVILKIKIDKLKIVHLIHKIYYRLEVPKKINSTYSHIKDHIIQINNIIFWNIPANKALKVEIVNHVFNCSE